MTSPGWPTNLDATYSDDTTTPDPSVKLHQQLHDATDAFLNEHAVEARAAGFVFVHNGTLFVARPLVSADVPTVTIEDINADGAGLGNYTFVLADAGKHKRGTSSITQASTWTLPGNSSVPYPVGTAIGCSTFGTGQITMAGAAGVTLRSVGGASKSVGQYAEWVCTKIFTDTWLISGGITT